MTDMPTTREGYLALVRSRLAEARAELAMMQDQPAAWIVRNDRGHVSIQFDMQHGTPKQPRHASPIRASRFDNEARAAHYAAQVFNGAKEPARAVLLTVALQDEIESLESQESTIAGLIADAPTL